jgi:hypothetical protein
VKTLEQLKRQSDANKKDDSDIWWKGRICPVLSFSK